MKFFRRNGGPIGAVPAPVAPPVNTVLPAVSGTTTEGQTLTGTTGTWTGTPTITYARQWYRADPVTSGGTVVTYNGSPLLVSETAIPGATASTYVQVTADVGMIIWERVTATAGDGGSAIADSAATGPVASASAGLSLDFTTGSLPSGVTASGGANGTRINVSGALVAASAPRFDYNPSSHAALGVLVERATDNLAAYSTTFDTSNGWTAGVPLTSGVADPFGGTGAFTSSAGDLYRTYSTTNGQPYTNSVWIRRRTGTGGISLRDCNNTDHYITGSVTGTWTRFEQPGTASSGTSYIVIHLDNSGSDAIDVYAPQAEPGSTATTYVPAVISAVTRSADLIEFTIPGGVTNIRTTYEDNTTADEAVTALATYTIPAGQKPVKTIVNF